MEYKVVIDVTIQEVEDGATSGPYLFHESVEVTNTPGVLRHMSWIGLITDELMRPALKSIGARREP